MKQNKKYRFRQYINTVNHFEIINQVIDSLSYFWNRDILFNDIELCIIQSFYETFEPSQDEILTSIIYTRNEIESLINSAFSCPCPQDNFPLDPINFPPSSPSYSSDEFNLYPPLSPTPSFSSTYSSNTLTSITTLSSNSTNNYINTNTNNYDDNNINNKLTNAPFDNQIESQIDNHEQRITLLEEEIPKLQALFSSPRNGGDRAGWIKIRPDDLPTRSLWYHEGGVYAYYSDGLGPLVKSSLRRKRTVYVHSTAPDIIEEHPDPSNYDNYARIVMVYSFIYLINFYIFSLLLFILIFILIQ